MGSLRDKVTAAKVKARKDVTGYDAGDTVMRNAKTAKIDLTTKEYKAAKKVLEPRMAIDRKKTAARGEAILKRETKKAAAKRAAAAVGNTPAAKKVVKKAVTKKAGK
jgi:predicted metal-binding transcription factor (methanogenesis marker protein 9)